MTKHSKNTEQSNNTKLVLCNGFRVGNYVYGVSDRIEYISMISENNIKTKLLNIDSESQLLFYKDINPITIYK